MAAALIGGLPGAGASIRTIVNIQAGGRTRLSGVIHGVFLLAVLLGLSGAVQEIPHAVLAGILVAAGISCIDLRGFGHLNKVPRSDAALMLLVLVLTVVYGVIAAVGFTDLGSLARSGKLLVLRMERIRFMDQSGAYALHDALVDLKAAGVLILIVGLPMAERDILAALRVVPDIVPEEDLFDDFASLKAALPAIVGLSGRADTAAIQKAE
jgi:MFS superfamily sulfate permease-like transporter